MRHHHRKPDPLILLAVFVGLGVIVTTGTLAVGSDPAPSAGAAVAAAPTGLEPTRSRIGKP